MKDSKLSLCTTKKKIDKVEAFKTSQNCQDSGILFKDSDGLLYKFVILTTEAHNRYVKVSSKSHQ